jgi:hypothetical protein
MLALPTEPHERETRMTSSNSSRRRIVAVGATLAVLGLGGTGVAIARSSGSGGDNAPYTSSVTVADTGTDSDGNDAALAGLAKITPEQAKAAALASVPGTAGKVELENEDGNVVFGVEVTTATGSKMDVKVDAGNGKVLAQQADDEGGSETDGPDGADTPATPAAPTTVR